jgi:hypothetical protein
MQPVHHPHGDHPVRKRGRAVARFDDITEPHTLLGGRPVRIYLGDEQWRQRRLRPPPDETALG